MNINWEKAVLGTALSEPTSVEAAEELLPSDFTGCHQLIWAEILGLYRAQVLDVRGVIERLRENGSLGGIASFESRATGEAYFAELLESRGVQMSLYAEHVLDGSVKRQLRLAAGIIAADAMDEHISGDEALDNAEKRLMTLRRDRLMAEGVTIGDILAVFMPRLESMLVGEYEPAWTPHLQGIRSLVEYLEEEDYMVGAGRPGDGKSTVMRFEAMHSAMNRSPVAIFNLENSHADYARGFISLRTGIDSLKIKSPSRLTDDELISIRSVVSELAVLPIHIISLGSPSISQIDRIARRKISQNSVTWIGIDYIQLVANGVMNKVDDVTISSQGSRAMALNYKVPVWANSQLNRNIEHRSDDAEPELSDLRDSGSLEQDATIVLFYRRRWRAPTNGQLRIFPGNIDMNGDIRRNPSVIPLDIYCKKHRNGITGIADPVAWTLATGDLRTLDPRELPAIF